MAENTLGAYHLSANPDLYEQQRNNSFEFIVTGVDNILRAGANENDNDAIIANISETLRFSVVSASIPMFTQELITTRRGNSVMKAAGVPTFGSGNLTVNDYIGADSKSALMAWQNLSYNVRTQRVGLMKDYKKICYLIEYTPAAEVVRTWKLMGCWISGLSQDNFSYESGDKKVIQATIEYDYAYVEMPD